MNPKKKFFLFRQSRHFCSVPWNHVEVFTDGSLHTCSKGISLGNINQQPLEQILQSDSIKNIKQDLLDDVFNDNCQGCHQLSTSNEHFDLRNHYNPMFSQVDIDYEDISAFELHGIDLHWDNTCNFKCVYCNPKQSSLIAQEQGVPNTRPDAANIDRIIELIVKNQYSMKEIYMSGGEPLLVKHNAKLLRQISNTDLPIRINSNLSLISNNNPVFTELRRFKNVLWTVSADNQGARFEYARNGSDWNKFLENLDIVKHTGHQVRLNAVWFVANVLDLFDTVKYFIEQHGVSDITVNQLHQHSYLQARHAPEFVKQQALTKLDQLLNSGLIPEKSNTWYNIARCERELKNPNGDQTGYMKYFDQLDQLRGTNWQKVFPELVA
jgi:radical SAM protein with 4Fe4S-binding SPASM domain